MTIQGIFNNYTNDIKYKLYISSLTGSDNIQISDAQDPDTYTSDKVICFAEDPISISCDYSDTFNHTIIKSATINLVTNFNLKDLILSANQREINVEISSIIDETETMLFKGNIEPLCFSEPYANKWETVEITATDLLAGAQYLNMPEYLLNDSDGQSTTTDLINIVAQNIGLINMTPVYRGIDSDILDAMSSKLINNSIWFGDSPDDWYTFNDVLEEIGKYWGLWFMINGDRLLVFDWHNKRNVAYTNKRFLKEDFTDASTSLSNADAYSQIKLQCDVEDTEEIVEFGDDIVPAYDKMTKYLEQYVATGGGSTACDAFKKLLGSREYTNNKKTKSYIIPNYCQIYKSDSWQFKTDYLSIPNANSTHPQQDILQWLRNAGKGAAAFIAFGQGEKISYDDNSPQNSIGMKPALVISVMGHDDRERAYLESQISNNSPICSYTGTSSTFTPPDSDTTNYIVISGNILLNRLQALTGFPMHVKYEKNGGGKYEDTNSNLYLDTEEGNAFNASWSGLGGLWQCNVHEFNDLKQFLLNAATNRYETFILSDIICKCSVPKISDNEYGAYYQHRFCYDDDGDTSAGPMLYGDLHNDKFNEAWQYEYSQMGDGTIQKIDNLSKIPIIKCQLKIGDKYCVERIDDTTKGLGVFEWMTEEDCPTIEGNKWTYFTIGINPALHDHIIGYDYPIANNIWYYDNLNAKGTAIPIKFTDNLNGVVQFDIIGPMDEVYSQVNRNWVRSFLWWGKHRYSTDERPILAQLSSIIISELKIEVTSNKGNKATNTGNNDLVYASDEDNRYIESHEESIAISTMITSDEAAEWGTEMHVSNSHLTNADGSPFLGFPYDAEDEQGNPIIDEETGEQVVKYIKPEQIYVEDFYKEYSHPRTIVDTQVKIDNLDWILNPEAYSFNFNFINGTYLPISFEADLKYNNINFSLKNMTNE